MYWPNPSLRAATCVEDACIGQIHTKICRFCEARAEKMAKTAPEKNSSLVNLQAEKGLPYRALQIVVCAPYHHGPYIL